MKKAVARLRRIGILGLNQRNAEYTLIYNRRSLYPLVDDKLKTKALALKAGLSVPELYGVIRSEYQIRHKLYDILGAHPDAVIKPSKGSGGNGIMVLAGRFRDRYRTVGGTILEGEEVGYHVSNILSGMYSLGGQPDNAMIEYRVQFDPIFERISYMGVPDIRIIVFQGFPVMSMVRLPTRDSKGRANLHQGAIGAGIDIATGVTGSAVWKNMIIDEHPDTYESVRDVVIPHWDQLLRLAAGCYELTGLGYMGVDIVLDKVRGPLILELNARPGLSIQIANQRGLLPRLRCIENRSGAMPGVEERVTFSKEVFRKDGSCNPDN
ncbi:MAG: alpha-L-glutamate ligase-like protein [Thermodesulfobacteriota bacterium]